MSKVVHPKYLRGFYKYLLCSKKNSGELLWSAHTVLHTNCLPLWHRCNNQQNLFLPWWRTCADAHKTAWHTFVSSGWGAGNKEAELLTMPGGWGWGIPAQHKLLSLNSQQDTRHFSEGKSIKPWIGEAGKGGSDQRAGGHAMCHLPCSLMFSKILCYYAALCVCVLQYT